MLHILIIMNTLSNQHEMNRNQRVNRVKKWLGNWLIQNIRSFYRNELDQALMYGTCQFIVLSRSTEALHSFNLQYPKSFIYFAKSKAPKIHKNQSQTTVYSKSDKICSPHRYIILPNNFSSHSITNNLNKLNIKTTSLPSKTFHELVHSSPQRNIFSDAGVYCIPCKDCKLKYIGETSQNLHVRLNTKET